MIASYKFLQKLWVLHSKILKKTDDKKINSDDGKFTKFTNQLINKITQNLEKFHYNVIVANLHEMYNFLIKEIEKPIENSVLMNNYKKILISMIPFIPHFANECLEEINQGEIKWPTVSKGELIEENINFVIQINGKKRGLLNVKNNINEKDLIKVIKENEHTQKLLIKQKIQKTIFVSNRLINIII